MIAPRTARGLALLIGVALLATACGSGAATTGPGAATQPPVTEAPNQSAPTVPGFSFTMPSFGADVELEAMFPDEIGGEKLTVLSMTGATFLGSGTSGNEIGPVLTQLGKTPDDLTVAFAGTMQVTLIAFRIKGVPAEQFLGAYTASQGAQGASITDASFGGKSVKKIVSPGAPAVYLYLNGDVTWTIGGPAAVTDALLNEVFSQLP